MLNCCCGDESVSIEWEGVYAASITTSGQPFSPYSTAVLPDDTLSFASSIVLALALGTLLRGLFCPLVRAGVAAFDAVSIGCTLRTGA